jgi:TRAP-type C4-dicarboxylate transport system permease small subunit
VERILSALKTVDRVLITVLKFIAVGCLVLLTVILSLNILNRFLPITSFHWLDEIVELLFAGLVFYGAAAVWMTKGNFAAGDWLSRHLNVRFKSLYNLIVELLSLAFVAILLKYSWQIMVKSQEATAVFQIPKAVLYSCMPISAAIMVAYSIVRIILEIRALVKPTSGGEKV